MHRRLWWIASLVLVLGGVAVVLTSATGPGDFGWVAYTPLSHDSLWEQSSSSTFFVSRWQIVGCALVGIGLIGLSAGVGFRLGRRVRVRGETTG